MGDVYKAEDGGRVIALKILKPSDEGHQQSVLRFERELVLARRVKHPNVCAVHEMGDVDGVRYISMDYVHGQNLREFLQAVEGLSRSSLRQSELPTPSELKPLHLEEGLSPWQALRITRQICEGLSAIHDQSIIHRDLKPSNVMMTRTGQVVLLDFGLAYHPDADPVTATNEVLGTLRYMAPEQTRGVTNDARSDIYSVGLILFEMLTGRSAPGDDARLPLALRTKEQVCPPASRFAAEVPPELDAVVERCLRPAPEDRYENLEELRQDIDRAGEAFALRSTVTRDAAFTTSKVAPSPQTRRNRWIRACLAAAAAVTAALYWGNLFRSTPSFERPYYFAVAPFENISSEEDAYLAEGFTDAVMSRLMSLDGITVVSENEETGAPLQLEGSVQKRVGDLRVSFRLVEMPSGERLSAKVIDSSADQIFELQDRVAASVATELGQVLRETLHHPFFSAPDGEPPGVQPLPSRPLPISTSRGGRGSSWNRHRELRERSPPRSPVRARESVIGPGLLADVPRHQGAAMD